MTLIIASDYDPEGLDLADDAIRTLRDRFGVPVEYHRVAVTQEQISELDLDEDFNPAKESSSRFKSFVKRTGSNQTWEIEALPPEYLQKHLRSAIEANMDREIFEATKKREAEELREIQRIRREVVTSIG